MGGGRPGEGKMRKRKTVNNYFPHPGWERYTEIPGLGLSRDRPALNTKSLALRQPSSIPGQYLLSKSSSPAMLGNPKVHPGVNAQGRLWEKVRRPPATPSVHCPLGSRKCHCLLSPSKGHPCPILLSPKPTQLAGHFSGGDGGETEDCNTDP